MGAIILTPPQDGTRHRAKKKKQKTNPILGCLNTKKVPHNERLSKPVIIEL